MPTNLNYPVVRPNFSGSTQQAPMPTVSMNPLSWHTPLAAQQLHTSETHANARKPTMPFARMITANASHDIKQQHAAHVFGGMAQRPWSKATPAIFDAHKTATPKA